MNKMINKEECEHSNTRITLGGLWQCLECGAMLDERPNITKEKPVNNIIKEIKKTFKEFKKNYLFPELLLIYDSWTQEEYKVSLCTHTFKEYRACHYSLYGEAFLLPCWILSEEEVLRIMAESRIL